MGKSLLQNGGMSQGPGPGAALGARGAPAPPSGSLLAAARPSAARAAALAARPAGRGRGREARGVGPTLTFSQPVLEVGVTPSLAVEVNAVPDEEGPAHTGGDGTVPAHHLLSTVERGPKPTGRGSERGPHTPRADGTAPNDARCEAGGKAERRFRPVARGPRAVPGSA